MEMVTNKSKESVQISVQKESSDEENTLTVP